jgi:2-dehydropantoate 2-reductase
VRFIVFGAGAIGGSVETDYLNGEIVLLGRLAGVPTPANGLLQQWSNELARNRRAPGAISPDEFLRRLGHVEAS